MNQKDDIVLKCDKCDTTFNAGSKCICPCCGGDKNRIVYKNGSYYR